MYINVPSNASISYLTNLANLFAYGSDGVNPYTGVQANPIWKPLKSNLKVYIEFSNETWNSGFVQAETRFDGWANQLSQRALYDYLTGNKADPLYPGGGSNAYNDGAIRATYYNVNSSNDSAFLGTYNANPAPSTDGGSPEYFNNSASINGYGIGQGWVGLRDVQIGQAFKTAFGELDINAVATNSRVRPVSEWQNGGSWAGALNFINGVYGAQHPSPITCMALAARGMPMTPKADLLTSVSSIPLSFKDSRAGLRVELQAWSPTDPVWEILTPRHCFRRLQFPVGPSSRAAM